MILSSFYHPSPGTCRRKSHAHSPGKARDLLPPAFSCSARDRCGRLVDSESRFLGWLVVFGESVPPLLVGFYKESTRKAHFEGSPKKETPICCPLFWWIFRRKQRGTPNPFWRVPLQTRHVHLASQTKPSGFADPFRRLGRVTYKVCLSPKIQGAGFQKILTKVGLRCRAEGLGWWACPFKGTPESGKPCFQPRTPGTCTWGCLFSRILFLEWV